MVLAWHPDHIVGPARSTNVKPIFNVAPSAAILPFFMRGGAPAAHGPLLANDIVNRMEITQLFDLADKGAISSA